MTRFRRVPSGMWIDFDAIVGLGVIDPGEGAGDPASHQVVALLPGGYREPLAAGLTKPQAESKVAEILDELA